MKRHLYLVVAILVFGFGVTSQADDSNDELFRLRLENAALKARIAAGIAELQGLGEVGDSGGGTMDLPTSPSLTEELPPAPEELPPEAQPTPLPIIHRALASLNLTKNSVFGDPGCGADARVVIEAARVYGCRCIGIEIDPNRAESARRAVKKAGLDHLVTIICGNSANEAIPWDFDVAFVYLYPETLQQLRPRLRKLKRFSSYIHYVPGFTMTKTQDLYTWTGNETASAVASAPAPKPVSQPVRQQVAPSQTYAAPKSQPVAYWNGQAYTGRVCTNGRCAMCNSIARQLAF